MIADRTLVHVLEIHFQHLKEEDFRKRSIRRCVSIPEANLAPIDLLPKNWSSQAFSFPASKSPPLAQSLGVLLAREL